MDLDDVGLDVCGFGLDAFDLGQDPYALGWVFVIVCSDLRDFGI